MVCSVSLMKYLHETMTINPRSVQETHIEQIRERKASGYILTPADTTGTWVLHTTLPHFMGCDAGWAWARKKGEEMENKPLEAAFPPHLSFLQRPCKLVGSNLSTIVTSQNIPHIENQGQMHGCSLILGIRAPLSSDGFKELSLSSQYILKQVSVVVVGGGGGGCFSHLLLILNKSY